MLPRPNSVDDGPFSLLVGRRPKRASCFFTSKVADAKTLGEDTGIVKTLEKAKICRNSLWRCIRPINHEDLRGRWFRRSAALPRGKRKGTDVNAGGLVPLILRGEVDLPIRTWFNLGGNAGSLEVLFGRYLDDCSVW